MDGLSWVKLHIYFVQGLHFNALTILNQLRKVHFSTFTSLQMEPFFENGCNMFNNFYDTLLAQSNIIDLETEHK
jgi:hypothetical protein